MTPSPPVLVYQVFPDRFAIGRAHTFASKLARPDHAGFEHAPSWDARPRPTGRELFGGDLDGIAERLDHVASLGADALYLTPIFDAPSSHRYDARDFSQVDSRLGGDAAWERLVAACREKGIGLVLDVVLNHVSDEHPWFVEASKTPASPRRSWFRFDAAGRPICWRGHSHLPELRLEDPELRRELLQSPTGVVRSWLRRGASGWRIDCANDLGLEVCRELREATAEERAPLGVTGELVSWAAPYLEAGAVDGVMNYYFRESVIAALKGEIPGELCARNLAAIAASYPRESLLRSWNVVGSHDTARLRTVLGAREPALLALLLAFTFPGVPFVYAGDEIGHEGGEDPDNRRAMPWDRSTWDLATLERVRRLASLRRDLPALREGGYVALPTSVPSVVAFARTTSDPRQSVVILANMSERAVSTRVFVPLAEFFDALPLVDRLEPGARTILKSGSFTFELPAFGGALLVPEPFQRNGYDFWKRTLGSRVSKLEWLEKIIPSRRKNVLSLDEAAYGILMIIAEISPFLDDATLLEVESMPDALPHDMRDRFMEMLRGCIARNFELKITTVGGHGLRGHPENVRETCAILGLLGPAEYERVRQRLDRSSAPSA